MSATTLQEHVRKIDANTSHEEKLYKILAIYMNLFPVLDSFLVRYSPLGYLAEGIISLNAKGLVHIGEIRDDIRSFPIIYSAITERKAKYCTGLEYLKQTSSKYTMHSSINSLVVVPICFGSVVIGYICSSQFEEQAMRRIAWGESTKEMAESMEISEVTVKQYVKIAIKKLGAQNRSHAVGELYRRGMIS